MIHANRRPGLISVQTMVSFVLSVCLFHTLFSGHKYYHLLNSFLNFLESHVCTVRGSGTIKRAAEHNRTTKNNRITSKGARSICRMNTALVNGESTAGCTPEVALIAGKWTLAGMRARVLGESTSCGRPIIAMVANEWTFAGMRALV